MSVVADRIGHRKGMLSRSVVTALTGVLLAVLPAGAQPSGTAPALSAEAVAAGSDHGAGAATTAGTAALTGWSFAETALALSFDVEADDTRVASTPAERLLQPRGPARQPGREPPPRPCRPTLPDTASSGDPTAADRFAAEFPHHAAAEPSRRPGGRHWALIIGVNDYGGPTRDTVGSVPDALLLCDILLQRGWRRDHVLVLADGAVTRQRIADAAAWLARKAGPKATVVVSFSGHMRRSESGSETGLWLADNDMLWGSELGDLLQPIRADRMWITLQGCHSAGLSAPGIEGAGRVVTYSSQTEEKSFEDLRVGYSVQGNYLFGEGLQRPQADRDGDGHNSVQEAHRWLRPRAAARTTDRQTPVIVDGLGQPFLLETR